MESVTVLTSLTYLGHNIQPISSVQSDSQCTLSSGWNAMAQMLYLLHSSFAPSRVCVYAYTKNTPGQNTIRSYWITPALFSHSWTSWHIVNSAECVPGHSNLLLLQHWHFAMNSLTITEETGKGLPGCFLTFLFFWPLKITWYSYKLWSKKMESYWLHTYFRLKSFGL